MTEEHDIKWAARMMDEGKRVRRPHFPKGRSWGKFGEDISLFCGKRNVEYVDSDVDMTTDDLRATDWEIAP